MEIILEIAGTLDDLEAVSFCHQLQSTKAGIIGIDIKKIEFARPFGILIVASQIKCLKMKKQAFMLYGYTENNPAHTYMAHVGFFQFLGLNIGNKPGEATGSSSYLPITVLSHADLIFDEQIFDVPIQKAIGDKAEELARVLTQSNNRTIYSPVAYCFRELIRNVFEHAKTDECLLAGQAYGKGRVSIAVVDYGRGLRESLSETHSVATDLEAIKLAIRPAISRTVIDPDNNEFWVNSGFGLYVLSELGSQSGRFKIMSGNAAMGINDKGFWSHECSHVGTAVGITFTKPYGQSMEQALSDIIARGEAQAKLEGRATKASRSSRTVD